MVPGVEPEDLEGPTLGLRDETGDQKGRRSDPRERREARAEGRFGPGYLPKAGKGRRLSPRQEMDVLGDPTEGHRDRRFDETESKEGSPRGFNLSDLM